jgi:aryl carrier-like protein
VREVGGLVALDAVLLGVGLAWSYGLGLSRTGADALRLLGLAFLLGWAATGVAVTFALAAGLTVTVWQSLLIAAGLAAGGLSLSKVTLQQSVAKCFRGLVREHVEECLGRSHPESDVQEHVADTGMPPPVSEQVDDHPCLLVARTRDAELVGNRSEAAMGIRDYPAWPVESCEGSNQARIEAGSGAEHAQSVRRPSIPL